MIWSMLSYPLSYTFFHMKNKIKSNKRVPILPFEEMVKKKNSFLSSFYLVDSGLGNFFSILDCEHWIHGHIAQQVFACNCEKMEMLHNFFQPWVSQTVVHPWVAFITLKDIHVIRHILIGEYVWNLYIWIHGTKLQILYHIYISLSLSLYIYRERESAITAYGCDLA